MSLFFNIVLQPVFTRRSSIEINVLGEHNARVKMSLTFSVFMCACARRHTNMHQQLSLSCQSNES